MDTNQLDFPNGISLSLAFDGERFLGIGEVTYEGTPLRNPALPWTLYAESELGYRFEKFHDLRIREEDPWTVLEFAVKLSWLPRVNEVDSMGDSRMRARRLKQPEATVRWRFRPITEKVWDNEWTGLAMQVEIDCEGTPIHWLLENTTWEIGGEANGCTLIQQDMTGIDLEQSVTRDNCFSTSERFFTNEQDGPDGEKNELPGGSFPIDVMPRGGGSAPLDFQAKDDLAMCLFAEKPGLTRARLEKFRSENVIHYTDWPMFALTEKAVAPERKLLIYRHPQALKKHEARNLWLDAFTEARRRIHESYGFTLEIPRPTAWCFMWNFDLEVYMADWIQPLIDALPEYKRLGYADIFTHGAFEGTSNNFDIPGRNVCLNYDYRYCEEFGGPSGMKRLFDAVREQGMRPWQWFGFYLAPGAPLMEEHPEWRMKRADGEYYGGLGRMRSGWRDHLHNCLKTIRDETGLEGAFWDSYQNTGLTNIDWGSDDKSPHTEEIWRFQAELQQMGIHQRSETCTIFGISTIGIYGYRNDPDAWAFRRRWWERTVENDDIFAWLDTSPTFFTSDTFSAKKCSPTVYFWMAGHRSLPTLDAFPWGGEHKGQHVPSPGPRLPGEALAEEYGRVNRLYNAALPHMHRLRVTEGGDYSLWHDEAGKPAVAWAFKDCETELDGPVTDLETGESVEGGGAIPLKAECVYLVGER
jgi:hypothetical protein